MKYRDFKGDNISEVGLGTWQLGSADWGEVREEDAFQILDTFVSLGGNFIDTADVYGMGISEKIIGRFLSQTSSKLFVGSKLGRRTDKPNGWPQNFSLEGMRQHVEASLSNLGLNQLFLEQLHCIPKKELEKGDVFDHLRNLQNEGLIQHWGVSVETNEEAFICLKQQGLSSIQIIFNLFRQHIADELFARAKEKGVALIIRVPLASGLLTGKFNERTTFAPNDHRNFNAHGEAFNAGETFSGVDFKHGLAMVNELSALLPDDRISQWAIRWILDHPEVTTVIPGASKISQVERNMASSGLPALSPDVHRQLRALYDDKIRAAIRGHY
jgi:aryl-alcohol dehydrogenase-like predicted oxidoreductase